MLDHRRNFAQTHPPYFNFMMAPPWTTAMFKLLYYCLVSSSSFLILQPNLRHLVCYHAYRYYLKLVVLIHVWIAINKFIHCHQLFNYVCYLDINWSISDTAGLLCFIFQSTIQAKLAIVNYQDSCFISGFTSCSVSTHDLLLPTSW